MAHAQPGDPSVDKEYKDRAKKLVHDLRKNAKNLDAKTLSDVKAYLFESVAVCERYQGVRGTQDTSVIGGGRRKR